MAAKLAEGDTITMQGEVTMVQDDGIVTGRPLLFGDGCGLAGFLLEIHSIFIMVTK